MSADWAFLVVATPFLFIAAYTDLAFMKIKNWMNAALALAFLVPALIYLPMGEIGFRLIVGAGLCFVLILFAMFDSFGGGDAKYLGALAPYIAPQDYLLATFILSLTAIIALVLHRAVRRVRAVRALAPRWTSWRKKKFPMGYAISGAALFYFVLRVMGMPVALG